MALSACFRQEYGLGVTGYLLTCSTGAGRKWQPVFILRHFLATIVGLRLKGLGSIHKSKAAYIYDKSACTLLNPACDIYGKRLVQLCSL